MATARFLAPGATSPQPAGSLTVKASPGCEVFWEGVSLGRVAADGSLRIARIPPGVYTVSIRMSGFAPEERRVSIGHDDQTIAFHLKSITVPPSQTDSAPLQVAPEPPPATKPILPVQSAPSLAGDPAQSSLAPTTGSLEERSSQIQDTLQTPLFWSIVVICALLAALFRFLWWQRSPPKRPATVSGRGLTQVPLSSRNESDSNSWPSAPAFLEDLKRREHLTDRPGAAPPNPSEEPIELGRDDVRAIEE